MSEGTGPSPDEKMASSQEISCRSHFGGVFTGKWEPVNPKHIGDTSRVDGIVFILFAALLFYVESMSKENGNRVRGKLIDKQVPVER